MLEITKKTVSLEPQEVMELDRIMIDEDQAGAYSDPLNEKGETVKEPAYKKA